MNCFQEPALYLLLFQSFFCQPVFQHISDFHVICFGKGEMAVAAYADFRQAHNAGFAAVAVDRLSVCLLLPKRRAVCLIMGYPGRIKGVFG